jgi:hypothetical protein
MLNIHPELERHIGKFYGKYSGEVTDNSDSQQLGWITVKVPSVFGADMEVKARPCMPYGHFFVPHVGAKVWVEFEAGDPTYPIWVGAWYPVSGPPPEAAITPPDNRVIQTPSGHTIEIQDKDGQEKISIRHKTKAFIAIDKDGSVILSAQNGSTVALNAKAGNVMVVESNGNSIALENDHIVLMNKGGATLEMKGGTVQISGTAVLLRGSQVVLGEGAAEPVVLGNVFSALFNAHTHATALGPSGPPLPPLIPQVGPHLSTAAVAK